MGDTEPTRVKCISWGKMEVDLGSETSGFRDCKVWPGGATQWDWRLTDTHHQPGIQPADVEEILQHNVEVMVLSRGQTLALGTCPETEQVLRNRGIEYHIEETKRAVELFNTLTRAGKRVGGIFHSTC